MPPDVPDSTDQPYRPSPASAAAVGLTNGDDLRSMQRLITPGELWGLCLQTIQARIGTVLPAAAVGTALSLALHALPQWGINTTHLFRVIEWTVDTFTSLWIIFSAHDWLRGAGSRSGQGPRATTNAHPMARAGQALGPGLIVNFLAYVLLLLGLILLIVPGVMAAVYFSLCLPIVALDQRRGIAALRRSRDLVLGRWGDVFTRLVVLGLPFLIALGVRFGLTLSLDQTWLEFLLGDPWLLTIGLLAYSFIMELLLVPVVIGTVILWQNLTQLNAPEASNTPPGSQNVASPSPAP